MKNIRYPSRFNESLLFAAGCAVTVIMLMRSGSAKPPEDVMQFRLLPASSPRSVELFRFTSAFEFILLPKIFFVSRKLIKVLKGDQIS